MTESSDAQGIDAYGETGGGVAIGKSPGAWLRVRFFLPGEDDYRPIKFPPPGPYWCTGYSMRDGGDAPVIVAYVKTENQIIEFWPEAADIDIHERDTEIVFTTRFAKPAWWQEIEEGRKP